MNYRCKNCGITESEVAFRDKCFECNGEIEPIGPFYVNTYLVERCYGGPEEGGWWYDCGEPMDSRLCDSYEEMLKVREEMEKKCQEENKGRPPIYSVLSNGELRVATENHFAEKWPQGRPLYE